MRRDGLTIAVAAVALVTIAWLLTRDSGLRSGEVRKMAEGQDIAALKKLPNYVAAKDNARTFSSHADFIRYVNDGLPPVLPRGARGILIAHAARGGGWHVPGRVPLYWNNLWGQAVTRKTIETGVLFTILRARSKQKKEHPFRAYRSVADAYMGYVDNIGMYGTGALGWLMSRGMELTEAECIHYCRDLIPLWFSKKTDHVDFGGDLHWIWERHIREAI